MTTDSELTPAMLKCIQHALRDYLFETDRYLQGSHTSEPGPTDLCCDDHLYDWKRKDEIQRNLQKRRDGIVDAIRAIEARLK